MGPRVAKAAFAVFLAILAASSEAAAGGALTLDSFISQTIMNNPTVRAYVQQTREAEGSEY